MPPSGTPRRDRAFLAVLGLLLAIGVITAITRGGGPANSSDKAPATSAKGASGDAGSAALAALRYRPGNDDGFEQRAAAGFSHPLYAQVPGGALATAKRVAALDPEIKQAASAKNSPVDADTLEALVYLESAGRPNAAAVPGNVTGAVGLTQIVGETANNLLGMKIDLSRSQSLTNQIAKVSKQIARWDARGSKAAATRGRAKLHDLGVTRAKVDPRFVPQAALAATVKYLTIAKKTLGREDLAITSYHMGIGNLQRVLSAYGRPSVPYVQLYFDVDPQRSPKAYTILSRFQDDSATYYWRILAAKTIMAEYRKDPNALAAQAKLITEKASNEDFMHPPATNPPFANASAIKKATADGDLVALPISALNANGIAVSPAMGELAGKFDQPRSRYRALRRGSLAALVTIGAAVNDLTGGKFLTATSSVRDVKYQALLQAETVQATKAFSLHTAGWAVDISRSYASGKQAQMFQFVLTRMQALDLISWVREPEVIHFTAANDADARLGPILEVALGHS
ncbi:MAG: hypothetical protein AAGC46_12065 [Solirubrobacteraceae bacterium]|nr:hypothetical protein [Patulibacter sp.]